MQRSDTRYFGKPRSGSYGIYLISLLWEWTLRAEALRYMRSISLEARESHITSGQVLLVAKVAKVTLRRHDLL